MIEKLDQTDKINGCEAIWIDEIERAKINQMKNSDADFYLNQIQQTIE